MNKIQIVSNIAGVTWLPMDTTEYALNINIPGICEVSLVEFKSLSVKK